MSDYVIILAGNPGAGKSSLANSAAGEVLFLSGVSIGTGLTTVVETKTARNGVRFGDTPGLDDIETRRQAAQEINQILRANPAIKLIFVITLESGRIKPSDVTTIQIILDALPPSMNAFSVIINKVQPNVAEKLARPEQKTKLLLQLFAGTNHHTDHLHVVAADASATDRDNTLLQNPESLAQLRRAIQEAPVLRYNTADVKDIQHDVFERMREQHEAQIEAIRAANQEQLRQMAENYARDMERQRAEAQAQRDEFERRMDRLNAEHQRQLQDLNRRLDESSNFLSNLLEVAKVVVPIAVKLL